MLARKDICDVKASFPEEIFECTCSIRRISLVISPCFHALSVVNGLIRLSPLVEVPYMLLMV